MLATCHMELLSKLCGRSDPSCSVKVKHASDFKECTTRTQTQSIKYHINNLSSYGNGNGLNILG